MERRRRMMAVSIGAVALFIWVFTEVTAGGNYEKINPGQKSVVARVGFNDIYQLVSNELGGLFRGGNPTKDKAHENADNQNQKVCIACHGDMKTRKTPWHEDHISNRYTNLECTTCHSRKIAIGLRDLKGKVTVDRRICTTCHTQKFPAYSKEHQKSNWTSQHVFLRGEKTGGVDIFPMEILVEKHPECSICHKKKELNFCASCHDQHPHDERWVNVEHGKQAVATDFSCLRCHDKETWCTTQCHKGVTLPHNIPKWSKYYAGDKEAPQWLRTHPDVALAGQSDIQTSNTEIACFMCHYEQGPAEDFCPSCHHRQFEKYGAPSATWKGRHFTVVEELGSSMCQKCHLIEFCAFCHTSGEKPARGMFLNRQQQAVPIDEELLYETDDNQKEDD